MVVKSSSDAWKAVDVAIGAVVLLGILTALTGGLDAALGLVGMSVLCTLGGGLVVWIPLALFLGALVRRLALLVLRRPSEEAAPGAAALGPAIKARQHAALIRYAQRLGVTEQVPQEVYAALRRNGWGPAEIDAAWAEARRSAA